MLAWDLNLGFGGSLPSGVVAVIRQFCRGFPIDTNGNVPMVAAGSAVAPYTYQNGLKIDSNNNVVAATSGGAVWQNGWLFDTSGSLMVTLAPVAPLSKNSGLAIDSTGAICVLASPASPAFYSGGLEFDGSSNLVTTF